MQTGLQVVLERFSCQKMGKVYNRKSASFQSKCFSNLGLELFIQSSDWVVRYFTFWFWPQESDIFTEAKRQAHT